jgi:hypothetical protein
LRSAVFPVSAEQTKEERALPQFARPENHPTQRDIVVSDRKFAAGAYGFPKETTTTFRPGFSKPVNKFANVWGACCRNSIQTCPTYGT